MPAYACKVSQENEGVITSEAGRGFDRKLVMSWLEQHGEGYFLRDEGSPLDCQFFMPEIFLEHYTFENGNEGALFRRVVKI